MAMPKSIQTRFVGIKDNHNHYTSLRLLAAVAHAADYSHMTSPWQHIMSMRII